MPIKERIERVDRVRQWKDALPLDYEYTAGIAGEKFLRALKDGRLVAGRCSSCNMTFLPPRIYCVRCFGRVETFVEVPAEGRVAAVTTTTVSTRRARKEQATRFVYVEFDGVEGGLIHRADGGWQPSIGAGVRPKFVPKAHRRGSILDVEGFEPATPNE